MGRKSCDSLRLTLTSWLCIEKHNISSIPFIYVEAFKTGRPFIAHGSMVIQKSCLQGCLANSIQDEVAAQEMYHPGNRKMSLFLFVEKIMWMWTPPGTKKCRIKWLPNVPSVGHSLSAWQCNSLYRIFFLHSFTCMIFFPVTWTFLNFFFVYPPNHFPRGPSLMSRAHVCLSFGEHVYSLNYNIYG